MIEWGLRYGDVGSGRQARYHWAGPGITHMYVLPNRVPREVLIASLLHSRSNSILVLLGQRLAGGQYEVNLLEQISLAGVVPRGRHFEVFGVATANDCSVPVGGRSLLVFFLLFAMQMLKKWATRGGGEQQLTFLDVFLREVRGGWERGGRVAPERSDK